MILILIWSGHEKKLKDDESFLLHLKPELLYLGHTPSLGNLGGGGINQGFVKSSLAIF